MRAIGAAVLFGLGGTLGCQPDLDREAGALEILWYSVDPSADQLRATVRRNDESYALEADPKIAARLAVESVPEGAVMVLGEALRAGEVVQSRLVAGEVPAGGVGTVVINLDPHEGSDGGSNVGPIETGWLLAPFTFDKPDDDEALTVTGRFESALGSVMTGAQSQLGSIQAVTVSAIQLELLAPSTILELDRVWTGAIEIGARAAGGGTAIPIGQGTPTRAASMTVTPTGNALTSILPALLAGDAELVIVGTANGSGDDGEVDAKVSVKFRLD
ncbi:MAG: hypothetical protein IPG45_16850 [Deltaproteobacteria bacterium]|jgi:hypothetical protein|nr:hypothetical protein [Deltaproteobacteria bacterium]